MIYQIRRFLNGRVKILMIQDITITNAEIINQVTTTPDEMVEGNNGDE